MARMMRRKADHLKEGRERYQKLLKEGKVKRLSAPEKAQANPTSLRYAVNAKCYECCGGENWRNRTRFCNIFDCPLWNVRPYGKGISREECINWSEPGA